MKHSKLLLAIALSGTLVSISCSNSALSQQNQANNKNSSNQSQNQNSPQTQNQPQSQTTPEEAKRIALADAKAAFDAGKVTIIDTRDASSYNAEHIKGAINIPVAEFEGRYKEIPTNKQIIAYCS